MFLSYIEMRLGQAFRGANERSSRHEHPYPSRSCRRHPQRYRPPLFLAGQIALRECVHPASLQEIGEHQDKRVRATFNKKLQSYRVLKTIAPASAAVQQVGMSDKTDKRP
jgi:hypothetical protein